MPAGCIFADKGPAAFVEDDDPEPLLALAAVLNSAPFEALVALQLARTELAQSYEVGLIQQTPVPNLQSFACDTLAAQTHRTWFLKRSLDTCTETSHAFMLPALIHEEGASLAARSTAWGGRVVAADAECAYIQRGIDDLCFELYGITGDDCQRIEISDGSAMVDAGPGQNDEAEDDEGAIAEAVDPAPLTAALLSWALGVAFGRFDALIATGARSATPGTEPFDPLPVCPPGMLQNASGFPATPADVPADYPLRISWPGILVDDPGHDQDIEQRVREVLTFVWQEQAEAIAQEAGELLGVETLRNYLRKPGGLFANHLKRYSKKPRKAPIYWQLATPSASYSVWLYYHRFTQDTFYKVLNDYVTPKLQHEERKLTGLMQDAGGNPAASQRKEIAEQEAFVGELRAFREEVARVAPLWSPDLNDGVIINFAPVWRLVPQHRAWQKECKACWDKLVAGDYDWAHLAMHLWPERVVPKCAKDRSLAIAHGLEPVFWEEDDAGKWQRRDVPHHEIDQLIAERTSAAVKDALKSLLQAPAPVTSRGGRKTSGRGPSRRASAGPRSGGSSGRAAASSGPAVPDAATLDAVRQAIAAGDGGASKSDVLAATGLTDAQWSVAINALLADGRVIKTGAARGTRYHSAKQS